MVYNGKPSTGCYLCRRRKIKCDETRPGCRNCEIYGKECPGYRPAIVFQDDSSNNNSSVSQTRKWKSLTRDRRFSEALSPSTCHGSDDYALVPKPRWLAEASMEDRALCYFFDQYTIPETPTGAPGVLESIPPLYVLCRENQVAGHPESCLRWAVEAAALSSFAHEASDHSLALKAREKYGMALYSLKTTLEESVEKVQDGTLAAILLLVLFEDINGERTTLQSSHTAGLELFAQLHKHRRLDGKYSRCLFNFAYTQLQIQILGLGGRPRFDLQSLIELFDSSDPLQSLMGTVTKLSQLILNAPSLLTSPPPDSPVLSTEELFHYIAYARSLDTELSHWCRNVPEQWLPRIVYSTTGESIITYASISTGSLWNFYRSARIILQGVIDNISVKLEMLGESAPVPIDEDLAMTDDTSPATITTATTSTTESTPYDIVQNMIVDICRSIPFTLGDVDSSGNPITNTNTNTMHYDIDQNGKGGSRLRAIEGYELLWPFWHILTCHFSTAKQQRQAKAALARLDAELGIKLASKLMAYAD
ncbi:hypothetical protein BGW36DRAFT_17807 [Talaromyces proteolyticus]|uniref:Zn(2)-C6 fungal-type domain-containing protein n=1 Tax=Talaromyces proteolyticus TaxID=1131652 RepID=A0AAD4L705_9EURO|nr:uncharacterized protein BGW36DRAFT_17807 [Talaromyces proteolyticus]KAH8705755.1 hypothetical protein BGW36DRAFT_17807 [Talaromyces proteolyticus]